jgi:hypothetical protein
MGLKADKVSVYFYLFLNALREDRTRPVKEIWWS